MPPFDNSLFRFHFKRAPEPPELEFESLLPPIPNYSDFKVALPSSSIPSMLISFKKLPLLLRLPCGWLPP